MCGKRRSPHHLLFVLSILFLCEIRCQPPHQLLGVEPDAPPSLLKKAYRKKCLELHPDKHKSPEKKAWAAEKFIALSKAYEALLDEARDDSWTSRQSSQYRQAERERTERMSREKKEHLMRERSEHMRREQEKRSKRSEMNNRASQRAREQAREREANYAWYDVEADTARNGELYHSERDKKTVKDLLVNMTNTSLISYTMTVQRSFVGLAHNSTHLFVVEVADIERIRFSSMTIPLKEMSSVISGEGGRYLKIKTGGSSEQLSFLNIAVQDYNIEELSRFMASLEKHSMACRESTPGSEDGNPQQASQKQAEEQERESSASREPGEEKEEEQPTLALVDDGTSALSDAYVRLSSIDQLEILALTESHILHVWLPLPDEQGGRAQVFRAPLPYIKNVRSTSTGGLLVEIRGDWEPIELEAVRYPIAELREFFESLHLAVENSRSAMSGGCDENHHDTLADSRKKLPYVGDVPRPQQPTLPVENFDSSPEAGRRDVPSQNEMKSEDSGDGDSKEDVSNERSNSESSVPPEEIMNQTTSEEKTEEESREVLGNETEECKFEDETGMADEEVMSFSSKDGSTQVVLSSWHLKAVKDGRRSTIRGRLEEARVTRNFEGDLWIEFQESPTIHFNFLSFNSADLSKLFELLYLKCVSSGRSPTFTSRHVTFTIGNDRGVDAEEARHHEDSQQFAAGQDELGSEGGEQADEVGSLNWRLHILESELNIGSEDGEDELVAPHSDGEGMEPAGHANHSASEAQSRHSDEQAGGDSEVPPPPPV
ncbi:hypothetical protein GUITHDRAFT_165557 [Guillardia theta CCMP2712]|uniref:J domain-containing protein n=1 Tax=Guillardia theta (strain CCMP2712) TaxID=905079 RepID=L1IMS6_GUITC|nr:hypothetical protein GUITHDRAFT_165557 [Guillardia theta CCMP2712]EKX37115.1 hypothetical protein GUITHDRAFT_165557 [Guillardia theta CCMP2712]|eukprot:XP_005824095.1 hypothetical protein GUITHDRAFT_165557 [Guillardia theta CCMP2712]